MPPRQPRYDEHAKDRCACGHLVYVPGEPCLAAVAYDPPRCSCTNHHVPEAPGGDAA